MAHGTCLHGYPPTVARRELGQVEVDKGGDAQLENKINRGIRGWSSFLGGTTL